MFTDLLNYDDYDHDEIQWKLWCYDDPPSESMMLHNDDFDDVLWGWCYDDALSESYHSRIHRGLGLCKDNDDVWCYMIMTMMIYNDD